MHDAARVRVRDGLADTLEDAQSLRQVDVVVRDGIEASAVHELHGVERAAVGQRAGVVDRHDARVLEAREDAGLVEQPAGGVGLVGVQDLECDVAVELGVARAVDRTHAAAAERGDEGVARAREVRLVGDGAQVVDRLVRQPHRSGRRPAVPWLPAGTRPRCH